MSVKVCGGLCCYDQDKLRKEPKMLTTSETILSITVWILTGCGLFFGGRAWLRKRRLATKHGNSDSE
jgi:hypothetical protein